MCICGAVRVKLQPRTVTIVHLPANVTTLEGALTARCAPVDTELDCHVCHIKKPARVATTIREAGGCVWLQLLRFTDGQAKNCDNILFPLQGLRLAGDRDEDAVFDLQAAVLHSGEGLRGGACTQVISLWYAIRHTRICMFIACALDASLACLTAHVHICTASQGTTPLCS